jgi:hypothetical protein
MEKKTEIGIITLIVLFEILILICGIFSDSYMIKESSGNLFGNSVSINDKIKEFMNLGINLLIGFLSIKQIGTVSAAVGDAAYCCLETENDEGSNEGICADYPTEDEAMANCGNDYINMPCDNYVEVGGSKPCDSGYCYNEEYGTCNPSKRFKCVEDGGTFSTSLMSECQKGGCIVGSNCVDFETERQCDLEGGVWDGNLNDPQCNAYGLSQIKGACVYGNSKCEIKTEQECAENKGAFYSGYLCSHPDLGTICKKQDSIGCIEGRDEIFWFDSCGNMENIYSSDKDASWNGGLILSKEDSCGDDEGNVESKICGNCLSPMSVCSAVNLGVEDGDFICKDLSCESSELTRGRERINEETWCIYEGSLEDGKAVVGSEHWLYTCDKGEVILQDHSNQRSMICMEHTVTENEKSYTTASMVGNNHESCIYYNNDPDTVKEKCEKDYSCYIKNVDVDKYFKFSMCLPKYPKGAELKDDAGNDENFCEDIGSTTCTVYYEKDFFGNWDCIENCHCRNDEFVKKMQEFCINLGDCGTYVNYVGQGTDNIKIKGLRGGNAFLNIPAVSEIPWTDYVSYADTDPDAFIDSKDAEEYFLEMLKDVLGGANWEELQGGEGYAKFADWTMKISGATGLLIKGLIFLKVIPSVVYFSSWYVHPTAGLAQQIPGGTLNVGAWGGALMGFAVGAWLGGLLAEKLGRTGPAATTMVLSAGVAGAVIGYAVAAQSAAAVPYVGWVIAAIAAAVLSWAIISGWGETEKRYVDFTCGSWQAPTEDYDCSACNDNPLKPCTKYRCEALGQNCKLLNPNQEEENPPCEKVPRENEAPVVNLIGISEDYEVTDFDENKRAEISYPEHEQGCIQELKEIKIDFTTNEPAQCKWSFNHSTTYDLMEENYPDNGNSFALTHSLTINFPPLETLLDVYDIEGDIREFYGDATIYLRCMDGNNNPNIDEYMIKFCINSEPDRTAVSHALTRTEPENGDSLKYGTTEQDVTFYLHKPAECRYSTQSGIAYDDMTNVMSCNTDILNGKQLQGWPCTTKFDLIPGENNFYVRCKAQPWLVGTDEESERAVNGEDWEYILYVSENELKIDSTLPQGEITTGFEPISVELKVTTSGGINNGIAECSYKRGNYWSPLQKTDSKTHTQSGWSVMGGNHLISIQCEDSAGNIASEEISFTVSVDDIPPKVVRAYHDGSSLKLITDEEAKCYYDLDGCTFNLEDGTSMSSTFSKTHTTSWNPSITYYIKCEDKRGKINSGCAIKIIPGL